MATVDAVLGGMAYSLVAAVLAYWLRVLTRDGAAAAWGIGTVVFAWGGWPLAGLLVAFAGSSSGLTRWRAADKPHPEHRSGRTAGQVLANGAVAAGLAVGFGLGGGDWTVAAFAGAAAAATADTWATEIGLASRARPRLITTGAVVPAGQSGAVSLPGTLGGVAGAGLIALLAAWWTGAPWPWVWVGGVAGMVADSVLGATVEGRGRWMGNNAINLLATALGAAVAGVGGMRGGL
jgi:uncharacterized protein (TIGR00297 family)